MKKKIVLILLVLLCIPLLVNASSYSSATSTAGRYINNFLTPERYLKTNSGNLITKGEVEKTIVKDNVTASSYMYDGTKFWAQEQYVIGEEIAKGTDAKTKVTELVLHDTKVKGTGKYTDPWIFVDSYRVTVKSNGNGLIAKASNGEKTESQTISVTQLGTATVYLFPTSGYKYLNNNCGASARIVGNSLIIDSVEKDIVCYVTFDEERYSKSLETPCFDVTTAKYGKRTHCFDNAEPYNFYVRYDLGYFRESDLKTRLGILSHVPYRRGWTFDGYYVDDTKILISSDGHFETTYRLFDDKEHTISAKGHPNKYNVTFNKAYGSKGTDSIVVTFDYDMPNITVPQRPGYLFAGYYTGEGGTGTQYYNKNGTGTETWNEAKDTTLYAKWDPCAKGHYCPGDNVQTACAAGTYQDQIAQTSCKDCSAGTYQNETGKTSCKNCAAGTYQNETGKSSCKNCAAGTYQDAVGQSSCKNCAAGTYQDAVGQTTCKCCPAGQYQNETGKSSCKKCSVGKYQSATCKTSCTDCPANTYQDEEGKSTCKNCGAGKMSSAGSTSASQCKGIPADGPSSNNGGGGYSGASGGVFFVAYDEKGHSTVINQNQLQEYADGKDGHTYVIQKNTDGAIRTVYSASGNPYGYGVTEGRDDYNLKGGSTSSSGRSSYGVSSGGSSGGSSGRSSGSSSGSSGRSSGSSGGSSGRSSGSSGGSSGRSSGGSSGRSSGGSSGRSSGGGGGCFLAGTKVLTSTGFKNIEDIKENELVLTYNIHDNTTEYNRVIKPLVHNDDKEDVYEITVNGKVIYATAIHAFYVNKKLTLDESEIELHEGPLYKEFTGRDLSRVMINDSDNDYMWMDAKNLKVGYQLLQSDGRHYPITKIKHYKHNGTVYNLSVENNHNYFVSENAILVHNRIVK